MTLLAHRLNVAGHELPAPDESDYLEFGDGESRSVTVDAASEGDLAALSRSLALEPLGMEVDKDHVYRLECGERIMLLLLNRALATVGAPVSRLPAIVGHWHPHELAYAPIYYLMSDPGPSPSLARMSLVNPRGERAAAGMAEVAGTTVRITMRGLSGVGNRPMDIACTYEGGALDFARLEVVLKVPQQRRVEQLA